MAERMSSEPVIDVSTRGQYMYFIDKEGYVARAEFAHKKMDPKERARREQEKKEKKELWIAKRKAAAEAKLREAQEKLEKLGQ